MNYITKFTNTNIKFLDNKFEDEFKEAIASLKEVKMFYLFKKSIACAFTFQINILSNSCLKFPLFVNTFQFKCLALTLLSLNRYHYQYAPFD